MKKISTLLIILLIGSTGIAHANDELDEYYAQPAAERKESDSNFYSITKEPSMAKRIKKLGMTIDQFKESAIGYYGVREYNKDYLPEFYLKQLENHAADAKKSQENKIKSIDFEQTAKIQNGKQYICSDGYDSAVLKFNGNQFTFGDVNYSAANSIVKLDRANSTLRYNGTLFNCKPR
jgi:hypothetical protein